MNLGKNTIFKYVVVVFMLLSISCKNKSGPIKANQDKLSQSNTIDNDKILSMEKEIDKNIQKNPNSAFWHEQKAILLAGQGKTEEAEKEYKLVFTINPNDAHAYMAFGELKMHENKQEEGLKYIQKFVQLEPQNPFSHLEMAICYNSLNKYSDLQKECAIAEDLSRKFNGKCYETKTFTTRTKTSVKEEIQKNCNEMKKNFGYFR
jgi:tetratricopeptide (TPR) repeat protein